MRNCWVSCVLLAVVQTLVSQAARSLTPHTPNLLDNIHLLPVREKDGHLHWDYNSLDPEAQKKWVGVEGEDATFHIDGEPLVMLKTVGVDVPSLVNKLNENAAHKEIELPSWLASLPEKLLGKSQLLTPSENLKTETKVEPISNVQTEGSANSSPEQKAAATTTTDVYLSNFSHEKLELGNWYHKLGEDVDITEHEWKLLDEQQQKLFYKVATPEDMAHLESEPAVPNTALIPSAPIAPPVKTRSDFSGRQLQLGKWYRKIGTTFDITDDEYNLLPQETRTEYSLVNSFKDLEEYQNAPQMKTKPPIPAVKLITRPPTSAEVTAPASATPEMPAASETLTTPEAPTALETPTAPETNAQVDPAVVPVESVTTPQTLSPESPLTAAVPSSPLTLATLATPTGDVSELPTTGKPDKTAVVPPAASTLSPTSSSTTAAATTTTTTTTTNTADPTSSSAAVGSSTSSEDNAAPAPIHVHSPKTTSTLPNLNVLAKAAPKVIATPPSAWSQTEAKVQMMTPIAILEPVESNPTSSHMDTAATDDSSVLHVGRSMPQDQPSLPSNVYIPSTGTTHLITPITLSDE